jgi:glycosyltransferase involved in cell wall biosynthesis
MKILSIQYGNPNNPYSHGGLTTTLHETLKRMVPRHEITCFTGLISGPERTMEIEGIKYIQKGIGKNKYLNRSVFAIINSFFKPHNDYDLLLIPWDRYAPVRMGANAHCPVILELCLEFFSIPTKIAPLEPVTRLLLKKQLGKCRYLISMSEGVLKIARQYAKKVKLWEVLPGGVSDEVFQYSAGPGGEKHLLYLGRLDISHKGLDILLESYKRAGVEVPLVIAGDGIDKTAVDRLIKGHKLGRKVQTVGWVRGKEKYELIRNSLAVCIPSRVEGWGIVATEAAAMGKPVIGTKVVGLEEAVADGKTGVLVPKENIRAFTSAIKMIVEDKKFRRILGDHAREMASQFTWDKIAKKRETFFYKVIDDFRSNNEKFLEVQKPFFKKVSGRRRQNSL